MTSADIIQIVLLVLLLVLSGFFSSAETAMTTASRIRIRTLAESGNRRAVTLMKIFDHSDKMLSAILIGNNIVNLSASSLTTTLATRLFGSAAVGIATGLLTLLVLIFGEITPKTMAAASAEKLSMAYAPVIWGMMKIMTPLIALVDLLAGAVLKMLRVDRSQKKEPLTQQELRTLVDVGHEGGALESPEHQVISNVFDLITSRVREVMVPRADMVTVSEDDSYEQIREVFAAEKYSRLPVYQSGGEQVIGVINIKDFLLWEDRGGFDIHKILFEPFFTFEEKNTSDLLVEMREKAVSLTIVLDEYGQTVGMVTMEDLLEELVGQIRDEYDEDEKNLIRHTGQNRYVIEGGVKLDDINDQLGTTLDSEDYDSIGGYIIGRLEHLPQAGESVQTEEGDTLRVLSMDKNRVNRVLLLRSASKAAGHSEAAHAGETRKNTGADNELPKQ